jgi:dienelactone hydrolase
MAKKRKTKPEPSLSKKEVRRQQAEANKKAANAKILIALGSAIILIALLWTIFGNTATLQEWDVGEDGIMSYPTDRGIPEYDSMIVEDPIYFLDHINYSSRDAVISALLRIPNSSHPVPGILILPGAAVTKEGEQGLSAKLADMGYASMVIDQRNLGVVDFQLDGQLFKAGQEPTQHKMVFDALKAVDVMRQYPGIEPDNIAIIGISNGGRFAIIAAAIDPSVSGVVGISTSGYDAESIIADNSNQVTENQTRFLRSVDPDTYLDRLPPRKLVMIHMTNDSIIPINLAQATYNKAHEPKVFYQIEGNGHGYNSAMEDLMEAELGLMFS